MHRVRDARLNRVMALKVLRPDWGLAKGHDARPNEGEQRVITERTGDDSLDTRVGRLVGTLHGTRAGPRGLAAGGSPQRLVPQAVLRSAEATQTFQAALNLEPDLVEAHAGLARYYRNLHQGAEVERRFEEAARWEVQLRGHDRGEHGPYLEGAGALSLVTGPPGAQAVRYRYVERDRRLIRAKVRDLGPTPIREISLPMGDYLVVLAAEGQAEVRYPVRIERLAHWDGVAPGGTRPQPVVLPRKDERGPDEIYVPAGWFQAGGDREAPQALSRRQRWLDAHVFQRFPVTNRQYAAFLDDLVETGQDQDLDALLPAFDGFPLMARGAVGRFALHQDMTLYQAEPDYPVVMVDWHCAVACSRWFAQRSHKPWGLPSEVAWEKAARGVDGRLFPWGNYLDCTWCNIRDTLPLRPRMGMVDASPVDESPYGVRGMGGNVMDWCADVFRASGPPVTGGRAEVLSGTSEARAIRGGHWYAVDQLSRVCQRFRLEPSHRGCLVGIRLVRTL